MSAFGGECGATDLTGACAEVSASLLAFLFHLVVTPAALADDGSVVGGVGGGEDVAALPALTNSEGFRHCQAHQGITEFRGVGNGEDGEADDPAVLLGGEIKAAGTTCEEAGVTAEDDPAEVVVSTIDDKALDCRRAVGSFVEGLDACQLKGDTKSFVGGHNQSCVSVPSSYKGRKRTQQIPIPGVQVKGL